MSNTFRSMFTNFYKVFLLSLIVSVSLSAMVSLIIAGNKIIILK